MVLRIERMRRLVAVPAALLVCSLAFGAVAEPSDRRAALARLCFGSAATLEGGKSSVELLQYRTVAPANAREKARLQLEARYRAYADALREFHASASELLDAPDSDARLGRTLWDGLRACWHLDLDVRLLESYGVGTADQAPILSSLEACARFRDAAFDDGVQSLLVDALAAAEREASELRALREEVRELERLIDDLRALD